ncbi:hypothetical protein ACTMU2_09290 [Cupriavidus basilensis]
MKAPAPAWRRRWTSSRASNPFRNDPRSFATDALVALALARAHRRRRQWIASCPRAFTARSCYLPFASTSESLHDQDESVRPTTATAR